MKLDTTFMRAGVKSLCFEGFEPGSGKTKLIGQPASASARRPGFELASSQCPTTESLTAPVHIGLPTVCSCSPPLKKANLCVSACLSACLLARLTA